MKSPAFLICIVIALALPMIAFAANDHAQRTPAAAKAVPDQYAIRITLYQGESLLSESEFVSVAGYTAEINCSKWPESGQLDDCYPETPVYIRLTSWPATGFSPAVPPAPGPREFKAIMLDPELLELVCAEAPVYRFGGLIIQAYAPEATRLCVEAWLLKGEDYTADTAPDAAHGATFPVQLAPAYRYLGKLDCAMTCPDLGPIPSVDVR